MGIVLEDTYGEELEISVGKKVLLLLCSEENLRRGWGMGAVGTPGLVLMLFGTS